MILIDVKTEKLIPFFLLIAKMQNNNDS